MKKKNHPEPKSEDRLSGDCLCAIPVHLEVINGHYAKETYDFWLKDELLIGRGKACDVVFKDDVVSLRNSRVFFYRDTVYIEDLRSRNGTAIRGMRIHAPNRLRSCDVISIGSVRFVLKF